MSIRARFITRRIPGYIWVQFCIDTNWRWGSWWAYSYLVACHAFGPIRIMTLKEADRG